MSAKPVSADLALERHRTSALQAIGLRRDGGGISPWFIVLGTFLVGPIVGLSVVFGIVPMLALVSLLGAAVLVAFPLAGLWAVSVGALVLAGLVELYLPGLQQIRWVLVLMAALLGAGSVVGHLARWQRGQLPPTQTGADSSLIVPLAALFFALASMSAMLGGHGMLAAVSGLKGYFQVWGLWVALAVSRFSLPQVARLVWWLLPLALVQWPVVLHQFLVLVPLRRAMEATIKGLVAIDVVSGTFGGAMGGGGRSPILAVLAMAGLTLAVMCYRTGRVRSLALTLLLVVLCVGPLAFSEVKVIFVFLPLTLLVLFGKQIVRRPVAFVSGAMVMVLAMSGALVLYSGMIGVNAPAPTRWQAYVDASLGNNIGSEGYGNAGLNRLRVYSFWWQEHDKSGGLARTLFGHGPGATNTTSVAGKDSLAAERYGGFAPGLTGLSALLWEVGVVGAGLFLAFLLAVYRTAARLCADPELQHARAELSAARVLVLLLTVSLVHNNLLLSDLAAQTLLALAIALVLVARRSAGATPGPRRRAPFGIKPLRLPAGARV